MVEENPWRIPTNQEMVEVEGRGASRLSGAPWSPGCGCLEARTIPGPADTLRPPLPLGHSTLTPGQSMPTSHVTLHGPQVPYTHPQPPSTGSRPTHTELRPIMVPAAPGMISRLLCRPAYPM